MSPVLRVTYGRGPESTHLKQAEVARAWEAALSDSGLPIEIAGGNHSRPKLTFSPPLPIGATADAELVDVYLSEAVAPDRFVDAVRPWLPAGFAVHQAVWRGDTSPPPQASARWSDYAVLLRADCDEEHARRAVEAFLSRDSIPWEEQRETKVRRYNMRAMVADIRVEDTDEGIALAMRLRTDPTGTGRPEQVLRALGLGEARSVHRRRIVLAMDSPVRRAWRRIGRFAE